MTRISTILVSGGWTLRSGGAEGADTAFELGAMGVISQGCGGSIKLFLPWDNFNGHFGRSSTNHVGVCADALALASTLHPTWSRLRPSIQLLMARNCYQILGPKLDEPSDLVICWTPDGCESEATRGYNTGGTGQAIALASRNKIPVFNLYNPGRHAKLVEHLRSLGVKT